MNRIRTRRHLALGMLLGLSAGIVAAESTPLKTPLDKFDAKKLTAVQRPKGYPKEVLAVLGEREGRYDNLAFRADGGQMAVGGPDGEVHLWDLSTLRRIGGIAHKDVVCLAFSPSGRTLVGGDAAGNLKYWSINGGKLTAVAIVPAHKGGPIWAIAFSSDGKSLFTAGADKTVKVWDGVKVPPALKGTLNGHDDRVRGMAVSADGSRLVSTSDRDKSIRIWELGDTAKEQGKLLLKAGARSVAVSPDRKTLVAGCLDGTLLKYRLGDPIGEPEELRTGKGNFYSVAFSPDGKRLLGLVKWNEVEDRVFLWNIEGKQLYEGSYGSHIEAVAFDPSGRHLVVLKETCLLLVKPE